MTVGLDDLKVLSNLNDPVILWFKMAIEFHPIFQIGRCTCFWAACYDLAVTGPTLRSIKRNIDENNYIVQLSAIIFQAIKVSPASFLI